MGTSLEVWFDLRVPNWVKYPIRDAYAAVVDICQWADSLGFQAVTLGEHHTTDDNYLPSPIVMAGVIGGRTKKLQLRMIILSPFYNPIRLAEDLLVLDLATGGRAVPVISSGYRQAEFDLYGVRLQDRPNILEETVDVLRKAWSGKSFKYRGRPITNISPHSDSPPRLVLGASFPRMIRKAAAIADGLSPAEQGHYEMFRQERVRLGKSDPGPFRNQSADFLFITENPDKMWPILFPHWAHTCNGYNQWAMEAGYDRVNEKFPPMESVEQMKASPRYRVLTPEQCLEYIDSLGPRNELHFNPMQGGLDPKIAWESLNLFEKKVLPHLKVEADERVLW